jgi:hypothetical protein
MAHWLQTAFSELPPVWLGALLPILWFGKLKLGPEEATGLINCIYLMVRHRGRKFHRKGDKI